MCFSYDRIKDINNLGVIIMQKVKIQIKKPRIPTTEEEFIQYQKEYADYLRKLNAANRMGVALDRVKAETEIIRKRWIEAGIMDKNGEINKRYRRVIANK